GASVVTVTDTLPAKMTATAISGTNWTCTLGTMSCTRSDVLAAGASYEPITLTVSVATDAPGALTNSVSVSGGGDKNPDNNTATDPTTIIMTGPDPAIVKTHSGPFILGQTGTYTIIVSNAGLSATSGTVTVTDTLPNGLTFNAATGSGWACNNTTGTVTCTRSDALASNASYPALVLTVNVAANAPSTVINTANVSGGGDTNPLNNNDSDPTKVIPPPPDLTITKTHTGNFKQGQINASYTLTVTNSGSGPTVGTVTVTDLPPTGLTFSFGSGTGWFCFHNRFTGVCTRGDVLAAGNSYPPIT